MARIRTIKPEFFTSESVCSVSPLARLFFIGLWCEADREGFLKWKPKTLKIRYLPVDNCSVSDICDELLSEKMIMIHADGDDLICEIPAFKSHQVINNREKDSILLSRVNDASTRVEAEGRKEGKEGKGKELSSTPKRKVKTLLPSSFEITLEMSDWFAKQSFCTNMEKATDEWKDAMMAGGYKYVDWVAAWRNGMKKANGWAKEKLPVAQQQEALKSGNPYAN